MSGDYLVQSVSRALDIVELLNEKRELGITQIGQNLNLDKSTVYRLLSTLSQRGYVRQDQFPLKYSNTYKFFEMGTIEIDRLGLIRRANPIWRIWQERLSTLPFLKARWPCMLKRSIAQKS